MKVLQKKFLTVSLLFAVLVGRAVDIGDVGSSALLWMVNDNLVTEVTGQVDPVKVSDLRSRPDGLSVNYARVMAVKTDGSETQPVFLDLYAKNELGDMYSAGDFTDVSGGRAGPLWANVTGYEDASWSFMIELGNLNDSGDEDVWTAMAYSEKATYDQLRQFIQKGEILDPTMTPWQGGSYVVPEPTSGLLVLLGGALLALRRRRRMA